MIFTQCNIKLIFELNQTADFLNLHVYKNNIEKSGIGNPLLATLTFQNFVLQGTRYARQVNPLEKFLAIRLYIKLYALKLLWLPLYLHKHFPSTLVIFACTAPLICNNNGCCLLSTCDEKHTELFDVVARFSAVVK